MTQPTTQDRFSPPWFLIVGLLAGIAFVAYIIWDSAGPSKAKNANPNVVELTQANWQKEVVESTVPVFVDFTATWCGPCRSFAPTVDKLADRYKGKVKVAKFDMGNQSFSKGRKLAEKYGIDGIPYIMIFKGGDQPLAQFRGLTDTTETEITQALDKILATP
jgi:thioredoxin 1